jgi:protein arginine N-methyltransferase 1
MADYNEAEAKLYNHTHQLVKAHETLLGDANRNRPFYRALKKTVRPGMSVLDIGSGTGIWAIVAARLGAARVVAIEQDALLGGLIQTLAGDNGVADRVEVIQGHSGQVQLGKEFDLIITETIGYLAFDEQIVPTVIDARGRFLKPGGVLIPESVALVAAPARLTPRHKRIPAAIPVHYGFFEALTLDTPLGLDRRIRLKLVSPHKELIRADLTTIQSLPNLTNLTARWSLSDTSQINCFAVWAEATLTNGISLSTLRTTSWTPIIYRIKPFQMAQGEIEFTLTLTNTSNYWTATLSNDQHREAQSHSPAYAATTLLTPRTGAGANLLSHRRRIELMDIDKRSNSSKATIP